MNRLLILLICILKLNLGYVDGCDTDIPPVLQASSETDGRVIWLTDGEMEDPEGFSQIIAEHAWDEYGYKLPQIEFVKVQAAAIPDLIEYASQNDRKIGLITIHSETICQELKADDRIAFYYILSDATSLEAYNESVDVKCKPEQKALDTMGEYVIYPVANVSDFECEPNVLTVVLNYWEEFCAYNP